MLPADCGPADPLLIDVGNPYQVHPHQLGLAKTPEVMSLMVSCNPATTRLCGATQQPPDSISTLHIPSGLKSRLNRPASPASSYGVLDLRRQL